MYSLGYYDLLSIDEKIFFLQDRRLVWVFEFWSLGFVCYLGFVFCDLVCFTQPLLEQ